MATKKTHTTTRALRAAKLAASNHNSESFVAPGGELHQLACEKHVPLTTNQGVQISDNQNSLKAHPCGPTLLRRAHSRNGSSRFSFSVRKMLKRSHWTTLIPRN